MQHEEAPLIRISCYRDEKETSEAGYCYTIDCWAEPTGHSAYEHLVRLVRGKLPDSSRTGLDEESTKLLGDKVADDTEWLKQFSRLASRSSLLWKGERELKDAFNLHLLAKELFSKDENAFAAIQSRINKADKYIHLQDALANFEARYRIAEDLSGEDEHLSNQLRLRKSCFHEAVRKKAIELLGELLPGINPFLICQQPASTQALEKAFNAIQSRVNMISKASELHQVHTAFEFLYGVVERPLIDKKDPSDQLREIESCFDKAAREKALELLDKLLPGINPFLTSQQHASTQALEEVLKVIQSRMNNISKASELHQVHTAFEFLYGVVERPLIDKRDPSDRLRQIKSCFDIAAREKALDLQNKLFPDKKYPSDQPAASKRAVKMAPKAYPVTPDDHTNRKKDFDPDFDPGKFGKGNSVSGETDSTNPRERVEIVRERPRAGQGDANAFKGVLETGAIKVELVEPDFAHVDRFITVQIYEQRETVSPKRIAKIISSENHGMLADVEYPRSADINHANGLGIQTNDLAVIARAFLLAKNSQARQLLNDQLSQHSLMQSQLENLDKAPIGSICNVWLEVRHGH